MLELIKNHPAVVDVKTLESGRGFRVYLADYWWHENKEGDTATAFFSPSTESALITLSDNDTVYKLEQ